LKTTKIKKLDVQRRVVKATNGVQFYIEELIMTSKIGVWKIAKVYYSYVKAAKAMEVLDGNQ